MIKKILVLFFVFFGVQLKSYGFIPRTVIAEFFTQVYFAPEEYRGIYKVYLYSDGLVKKFNNKNESKVAFYIGSETAEKIDKMVNELTKVQLNQPEGPECMDAPTSNIYIHQYNGNRLKIWSRLNCREWTPVEQSAQKISSLMMSLEDLTSKIQSIKEEQMIKFMIEKL